MSTLDPLNARHAIPAIAQVIAGQDGLPAVHVTAPAAEGLVYLHGAHVAAFKPHGAPNVLWLSQKSLWQPGKPIRGGVPICFPWFGPRQGVPASPDSPPHGFARLLAWELQSIQQSTHGVTVALALTSSDATRAVWPHDFVLRHHVTFGPQLVMTLELTNTGTSPLTAEEALHTYFALADVKQVQVNGLAGTRYVDKADGFKEKPQMGLITITAETDRVYLDTTATVTLDDPIQRRRITIAKDNSRNTVVWNPWIAKAKAMPDFGDDEWPGMLCVETCNVGPAAVSLAPGQTHHMTARLSVAPLP
jgi:glucose-6-phosphate 1-epimerase